MERALLEVIGMYLYVFYRRDWLVIHEANPLIQPDVTCLSFAQFSNLY